MKRAGFKPGVKNEGVADGENGKLTEKDDVTGAEKMRVGNTVRK